MFSFKTFKYKFGKFFKLKKNSNKMNDEMTDGNI